MSAEHAAAADLRSRLTALVGFATPAAAAEATVLGERRRDGYRERALTYRGADGPVSALLLVPDRPGASAIVAHHQHGSRWDLGKSEVAGLLGDHHQAFGPALARRGVTVLAPDAAGFEDRRRRAAGTRDDARYDYLALLGHGLVEGRPLMGAVLGDAAAAHALLAGMPGLDASRVGALGHSMGGATALFHAALDTRVAFAAVSGAACTYRRRIADGTAIEAAQVVPGILALGDLGDVAALVAPRPLLLCSASEDRYSADAAAVAEVAAHAYRAAGAPQALRHARFAGGHALTAERFALVVDWVAGR